jgi:hypothetical protein
MAVTVIERNLPAYGAAASLASPRQARLRAFMPSVVHSTERLMRHLREQKKLREVRGRKGRDCCIPSLKKNKTPPQNHNAVAEVQYIGFEEKFLSVDLV